MVPSPDHIKLNRFKKISDPHSLVILVKSHAFLLCTLLSAETLDIFQVPITTTTIHQIRMHRLLDPVNSIRYPVSSYGWSSHVLMFTNQILCIFVPASSVRELLSVSCDFTDVGPTGMFAAVQFRVKQCTLHSSARHAMKCNILDFPFLLRMSIAPPRLIYCPWTIYTKH